MRTMHGGGLLLVALAVVPLCATGKLHECIEKTKGEKCNGRGVCLEGPRGPLCYCEPGYVGPYCQIKDPMNGCKTGRMDPETKKCSCPNGLEGDDCDKAAPCTNGCSGHGVCKPLPPRKNQTVVPNACYCNDGWMGESCDVKPCGMSDTEHGPRMCGGENGRCVDGVCKCDPAFTGPACGVSTCKGGCSGHGECVKDGLCKCADGFFGDDCKARSCPNDCSQHGFCNPDGECECDLGWLTKSCAVEACPMNCNEDLGWGKCADHDHCECHEGMGGIDCARNLTTHMPVFGEAETIYDPCKRGCLARCDDSCVPPEHHTFIVGGGRMLRSEIPRTKLAERAKVCMQNCKLDCKQRCLQKLESMSRDDRDDEIIELPSLKGKVNMDHPLDGPWSKDVYARQKIRAVGGGI